MLPISRRTLSQFISILACLVFVVWGFSEYSKSGDIPYEQAVGFLLALAALLGSSRVSEKPILQPSEKEMAARDAHNRQAMLNRVRDYWVKGVLESSLHEEARIELGLEERRDAVAERPWDVILRTPDRPDYVLPPGTKISYVFERVGRSLLILGEPGAGKTTTLLELAREIIDRAEKDPSEKITVVFNLSSWTDPNQTISEWLAEELKAKYNIPKKIAVPWVESDSLFLLLDGLDEVASVRRAECVEAINGFLDEHLVPVVVCCRKEEYEALGAKLDLQSAVLLQPLTPEQIDGYLERLSPDLNALREALRSDRELQEFAKTPLILSIVTLAYRGISAEDLQSVGSTEERRGHLFETYVEQMFERTTRIDPKPYPKEKTIRWLSWLAQKMKGNNQTIFLISRMQPSLLETTAQQLLYSILVALIIGLVMGPFGVGMALTGDEFWREFWLYRGLPFCWLIMLMPWPWEEEGIIYVETLNWSWKKGFIGLVFGLVGSVGLQFLITNYQMLQSGLFGGLVFGLIFGLSAGNLEVISKPNQGIKQSAKNALIAWLAVGLFAWLVAFLILALTAGLASMVARGMVLILACCLVLGWLFFLRYGGKAVLQHFALRSVLCLENLLPWNLVSFLDYATERIFLRKVGGGYVFVHRMLMDYFASLEPGPEER